MTEVFSTVLEDGQGIKNVFCHHPEQMENGGVLKLPFFDY